MDIIPTRFCDVEGCDSPVERSIYCQAHYRRSRRGDPMLPIQRRGPRGLSHLLTIESPASETEKSWAAGFFDGEGCIGIYNIEYPSPRIMLTQTDARPLERFVQVVQLGSVKGPYSVKKRPTNKPFYSWCVGGKPKVNAVLAIIWPYLSEPKKEQAYAMKAKLVAIEERR